MAAEPTAPSFATVAELAGRAGLAVRGAFHPRGGEFAGLDAGTTLVLLGFTGGSQWPAFSASVEARDGLPHPLDRWSQRVVGALAFDCGARALYPWDRPALPFQRLAQQAEATWPSPLGLLIHPEFGLWHAYRGALLFATRMALPQRASGASPCSACAAKPCLSACPVGAFGRGTFDVGACLRHLDGPTGGDCREHGCRARRACPTGSEYRYRPAQMRFHQDAFRKAMAPP